MRNSKNDRRRYRRHELHGGISVELRVEVSGDEPALLLTRGVVADISRGGVRCDIDFAVPIGSRVDLSFPDVPHNAMHPAATDGRVARTISPGGVPGQVAIVFDRPLGHLDADRLRAHERASRTPTRRATALPSSWSREPNPFPA